MSYARRLGAFVVGMGLAIGAVTVLVNPPLFLGLVVLLNCGLAVWWGVHVFVTKRPW